MKKLETVTINGVEYAPLNSLNKYQEADKLDGMPFVIVRSYDAGVYFGWLKEEKKDEVILVNARNVWSWKGANTILQMANDGVKNPDQCQFTQVVKQIKLKRVCAIIECTKEAQDNLTSVKIWEK